MNLRSQMLAVADAYQAGYGFSTTTVSKHLFSNPRKLEGLRREEDPADLTLSTFERAMQSASDYWPREATWPAGVTRPAPQAAESDRG